jgi:threonine dehydrogenase-like Zn-dependent dehydrogenase
MLPRAMCCEPGVADARTTIALDRHADRREFARPIDVTHTIDPPAVDPVAAVSALTAGPANRLCRGRPARQCSPLVNFQISLKSLSGI